MPDAFDLEVVKHEEQLLQMEATSMAQDRQIEIRDTPIKASMNRYRS